jgi:hypothetical protein
MGRRYTITVQAETPDGEPEKPIDHVHFVSDAAAIEIAKRCRDHFHGRYVELVGREVVWASTHETDPATADLFNGGA